jgi:hypothetical protein
LEAFAPEYARLLEAYREQYFSYADAHPLPEAKGFKEMLLALQQRGIANAGIPEPWLDSYRAYLDYIIENDNLNDAIMSMEACFYLTDINADGIPEMITSTPVWESSLTDTNLLYLKNGSVCEVEDNDRFGNAMFGFDDESGSIYRCEYGEFTGGDSGLTGLILPAVTRISMNADKMFNYTPVFTWEMSVSKDFLYDHYGISYSENHFYDIFGESGWAERQYNRLIDVLFADDTLKILRETDKWNDALTYTIKSTMNYLYNQNLIVARINGKETAPDEYIKVTRNFIDGLIPLEEKSEWEIFSYYEKYGDNWDHWDDFSVQYSTIGPKFQEELRDLFVSWYEKNIGSLPALSYPKASLAESEVRAVAEALAGRLDGELTAFYRLDDDLYYVVLTLNGKSSGGAVVKRGRAGTFRVIQSDAALLDDEALAPIVSKEAATSNVKIVYSELSDFASVEEYTDYLGEAIQNADGAKPNNAAIGEIVTYMENAAGTFSSDAVRAKNNRLTVGEAEARAALERARATKEALSNVLSENDVIAGRPVTVVIRIIGQGIDPDKPLLLTLDESLAEALGEDSVMFLLGDNRRAITVSGANLRTLIHAYDGLSVRFAKTGDASYDILFRGGENGDGDVADKMPAPVEISLPADDAQYTVLASFRGGNENWGGRYDENNKSIRFATSYSGSYEITENRLDIPDIENLSDERKEAAGFMTGKGFFDLENGNFNPDGTLNRYGFAKILTRMFFALDRELTTRFTDVPRESEFYDYIASAEKEDIVEGVGDDLYAGERVITREQAIAIAARTLVNKKGYAPVGDADALLAAFGDAGDASAWARDILALAVREGLLLPGESLRPKDEISRAEAALLLYRLFLLLYEVPPAEIELPAESAAPLSAEAVLISAIAGGVAALAALGGLLFFLKRRGAKSNDI